MGDSVRVLIMARSVNEVDLSAPRHVHDFHQFLYLFRGKCHAEVNGVALTVAEGHWLTLAPGVSHGLTFPNRKELPCEAFQLKVHLTRDFQERLPRAPLVPAGEHRGRVEDALRQILWAHHHGALNQHMATEGLLTWIFALLTNEVAGGASAEDQRMGRAMEWMRGKNGPIPEVRQMARQAGLDPSYFTRLFKQKTGTSPKKWMTQQKMEQARSLVVFSSAKLNEVARLSGYGSYHHFFTQFRAHFGKSPNQMRGERDRQ